MHHFFVEKENITGDGIFLTGENYNHAVNVLRLEAGERIMISDPDGVDYMCAVAEIRRPGRSGSSQTVKSGGSYCERLSNNAGNVSSGGSRSERSDGRYSERSGTDDPGASFIGASAQSGAQQFGEEWLRAAVGEVCEDNHELPAEVVLFQCLPKADKMELIIQKAVELGAAAIVPVQSRNCVVKLDDRKSESKIRRWQAIAESAAKQSKRSVIPAVHSPVNWKEALEMSGGFDVRIIPYEEKNGLTSMCEAIISLLPGRRIAVYIGPEGGFDPLEVSMARRHGVVPVSLGRRILRTETAAIAALSMIMIRLEIAADQGIMPEE